MTEGERKSGATRLIVTVLLLSLLGFSGYVALEKFGLAGTQAPAPAADARLSGLLAAGYGHLDAGRLDAALEQFQKASGIAEQDADVREALCRAYAARADSSYLRLIGAASAAERSRTLAQLEKEVDRAREAVAAASALKPEPAHQSRLMALARHLNTTLVLAYLQSGERQRASGALAARLGDHPDKALLSRLVGAAPAAEPETSAAPSALASAAAAASSAPAATNPPALAAGQPPAYPTADGHYELDHEPDVGHLAGANELKVPAAPPAPAPAPAPADL